MTEDAYTGFYTGLTQELRGLRVIERSQSRFLRGLFRVLAFVTRKNYSQYATTLGATIYVPDGFFSWSPDLRYALLRHEVVHVRQFQRWPLPWLGRTPLWGLNAFLMGFCYLFCFPVLLTCRAMFERQAYIETFLVLHELGKLQDAGLRDLQVSWMEDTFGGPAYLFMWTRARARAWAEKLMQDILAGKVPNPHRVA